MKGQILKYYKHPLFCVLLLCLFNMGGQAQTISTQGTDFWFAFMNNNGSSPDQTCLILSAQRSCSATVSNPNTGWSTTVSIPAGGRVDVVIPLEQGYHSSSTDGVVYNLGCHLVATDTISAFSMNYRNASFDGGHLMPTSTLSDEYMLETIPPGLNGSTALLVGVENGTGINITPSAPTTNGWAANSTYHITLNAGQVYQFTTTSTDGTLSGTRIITDDCKPLAVFAGGKCAQAPSGCTYCDHVYEPMIPIIYWGNHFIATSSQTRSKDVVRVTALNNNTTVRKNGSLVATLSAGGTYHFELTSSEGSCYLETSGPAVCYLYLTGQNCGGGTGDPSMVYIAPIEQNIKKITFGTYEYPGYTTYHYVNVVTPTINVGSVRLDGANISGQFTTVPGNQDYSFARVSISHATHTLECDSGLVAHVYGLYNVTSYAYSVGSSAVNLRSTMYINNENLADISENRMYCSNRPILFELDLNYQYDRIIWYFGDGEEAEGNPVEHQYAEDGTYLVMAVIERNGVSNCFGTVYDTLYTYALNVAPLEPEVEYRTVCDGGSYEFNDRILTEPGVYYDTLTAPGSDCDYIVELHLSFVPAEPVQVNKFICPGESLWFMGESYSQPGDHRIIAHTSAGCDSIVDLHVAYATIPTVTLGKDVVLCRSDEFPVMLSPSNLQPGNTYQWSTGEEGTSITVYEPGVYSVTVTNTTGCVSSDEMEIRVQAELSLDIVQSVDFCEDGVTTLTAITNAPNILWNTGERTPEIEVHSYGRYSAKVYDGPCELADEIEIDRCPFNLYFPNCISSSFEDGLNDEFRMWDPSTVKEFEIFI